MESADRDDRDDDGGRDASRPRRLAVAGPRRPLPPETPASAAAEQRPAAEERPAAAPAGPSRTGRSEQGPPPGRFRAAASQMRRVPVQRPGSDAAPGRGAHDDTAPGSQDQGQPADAAPERRPSLAEDRPAHRPPAPDSEPSSEAVIAADTGRRGSGADRASGDDGFLGGRRPAATTPRDRGASKPAAARRPGDRSAGAGWDAATSLPADAPVASARRPGERRGADPAQAGAAPGTAPGGRPRSEAGDRADLTRGRRAGSPSAAAAAARTAQDLAGSDDGRDGRDLQAGGAEEPLAAPVRPPRERRAPTGGTGSSNARRETRLDDGDPAAAEPEDDLAAPDVDDVPDEPRARRVRGRSPEADEDAAAEPPAARVVEGPIVAPATVAGRSLTVVVAIMTFLCALVVGGALVVHRAAEAWSSAVMDEITVTVLPLDGDPTERRLDAVAAALAAVAGLEAVRVVPMAEAERLLEPWLGAGADLSLLPVPRMVTARRSGSVDAAALRAAVAAVPGASLDDHGGWSDRLWRMASGALAAALAALALIFAATAITVVFATRATVATNAATVEVLATLGAEDRFIAAVFRRRFVGIGVRGAAAGAAAAVLLFAALDVAAALRLASPEAEALWGTPTVGPAGYLAAVVLAAAVTGLVAATAGLAVRQSLAAVAA